MLKTNVRPSLVLQFVTHLLSITLLCQPCLLFAAGRPSAGSQLYAPASRILVKDDATLKGDSRFESSGRRALPARVSDIPVTATSARRRLDYFTREVFGHVAPL